jgi:hypothetical protein
MIRDGSVAVSQGKGRSRTGAKAGSVPRLLSMRPPSQEGALIVDMGTFSAVIEYRCVEMRIRASRNQPSTGLMHCTSTVVETKRYRYGRCGFPVSPVSQYCCFPLIRYRPPCGLLRRKNTIDNSAHFFDTDKRHIRVFQKKGIAEP